MMSIRRAWLADTQITGREQSDRGIGRIASKSR